MGIYLKGVSKPQWCSACVCNAMHYCQALGRDVADYLMTDKFPDDCPLLEVPSHDDLIEREAALRALKPADSMMTYEPDARWEQIWADECEVLFTVPTIISAEEDNNVE